MVQNNLSGCKNLDNHASSDRCNSMDFKAMFKTIEANIVGSTGRVSGERGICVQYSSLPLRPWQKHPEFPNCFSRD